MAFLLTFLAPLIPYILGAAAVVAVYFGIQRRGVKKERARWEQKAREIQEAVTKAESKDAAIDEKVRQQIDAIKKIEKDPPVDSDDRFHF